MPLHCLLLLTLPLIFYLLEPFQNVRLALEDPIIGVNLKIAEHSNEHYCILLFSISIKSIGLKTSYSHLCALYEIIVEILFPSCANESGPVRTHQSMSELKDSRRAKVSHAKMGLSDEQFSGRSSRITCSRVHQTVSLPVI